MTTVSLIDTDHASFLHDGRAFIDQDTFDLALDHWRIDLTYEATEVASIYDGSSDVTYALAWYDGDSGTHVAIVQFEEDADGYDVASLPFDLDITPAPPAAEPPAPARFIITVQGTENWPVFANDVSTALSRGGLAPLAVTRES